MSDDNKFFRWVWRVNAVVLLLALIGGCACLAFQANAVFKWFPPSNTYTPAQLEPSGMFQPVPPKDGTAGKFELVVTEPGVVGKSQMLALVRQLARGMEGVSSGFSSQPGTQTVNILAVEPELAKAHWLFEGQNRWIVFHKAFAETGPDTALALEVIEEDTNKDGKVAPNDRHAFYVYSSARHQAIKLVTADSFGDIQQIGPDRLLIICYNGDKGSAVTFSLPDYKLQSRIELPVLPR